jgi:DMSO reductase family type II enzyme chaperone
MFPELLEHFNEVLAPGLKLACSREVFESQFLSAFETNMPSPSASLNEGVHIFKSDRPNLLLELKGFYSNFGLQVDSKGNELEDTLTAELDFMQFLALKQAQAHLEGMSADAYKLAQKDFLERHLCAWLPLVRREIAEKVTTPFFVTLAEFAESFALANLRELKEELGE